VRAAGGVRLIASPPVRVLQAHHTRCLGFALMRRSTLHWAEEVLAGTQPACDPLASLSHEDNMHVEILEQSVVDAWGASWSNFLLSEVATPWAGAILFLHAQGQPPSALDQAASIVTADYHSVRSHAGFRSFAGGCEPASVRASLLVAATSDAQFARSRGL
jgi:hypothetical protein